MKKEELIKLIKSKSQAVNDNLLFSTELAEIKAKIEQFLDQNLKGDGVLSLSYRKFKFSSKSRILLSDTSGFPINGKDWINPYINFFEQLITEKIVNRLENENLWVQARTQGNEQHLLVGGKHSGEKVHLISGETGEMRIDKKDQFPGKVFKKVESVLTKLDGSIVKSTLEFSKEKVDHE